MNSWLKDSLKVKSLITGTQAKYGEFWGLYREKTISDFIDMHSYWQHPQFPGAAFDRKNWYIVNKPMSADTTGGTFFRALAPYRISGLPFTISEYDHPFPSDYTAEGLPMVAAFGRFQNWDGIYQFTFTQDVRNIDTSMVLNFFNLTPHSSALVSSVLGALLFRHELVNQAEKEASLYLGLPAMDKELDNHFVGNTDWLPFSATPKSLLLNNLFSVSFSDTDKSAPVFPAIPKSDTLIHSDDLTWSPSGVDSFFLIHSDRASCAFGNIGGKTIRLRDVLLNITIPHHGFACAGLVALDSLPLTESHKMLFCTMNRSENSNMGWDAGRTTLSDKWGKPPVVSQIVKASISVPGDTFRAYALNGAGQIADTLPVVYSNFRCSLVVGDAKPSLWYYLERKGGAFTNTNGEHDGMERVDISPNPFNPILHISIPSDLPGHQNTQSNEIKILIFDINGRVIHTSFPDQDGNYIWNAAAIPSGVYIIRIRTEKSFITRKAALLR